MTQDGLIVKLSHVRKAALLSLFISHDLLRGLQILSFDSFDKARAHFAKPFECSRTMQTEAAQSIARFALSCMLSSSGKHTANWRPLRRAGVTVDGKRFLLSSFCSETIPLRLNVFQVHGYSQHELWLSDKAPPQLEQYVGINSWKV